MIAERPLDTLASVDSLEAASAVRVNFAGQFHCTLHPGGPP
jgi:hypothetical protein